ncbi:serine aminopeptidase domain-containing protein [Oceanirhabdus seepicola]|uniref:Alpha/beta hydrolase n=1 Tax=Oceanirhabdus seepicola TaxID=2828781 RepID=A0A9J6NZS5_9CLOT|nr:alpha/beta hydrolase [Oceanirhabdus seepicola]MCM1989385.1 alpha/beta hydrolase [Oceanirhabdus seepicola]
METSFIEEQVTINGEVILKGTLTIPQIEKEQLPAVLIINGSGAANRDGNIKIPPIKFNIYKKLSHFITELGFITLRYDKRGIGESKGNARTAGVSDLVDDINSNIRFLQDHPKVNKDKIILLGHSEGCILSTIANEITPVSGLILLSGAGTNLREPLKYQNSQIVEEAKKSKGLKGVIFKRAFEESKNQKQQDDLYNIVINSTGDTIKYKHKKMPAKWFREHFKYSSEEILDKLKNAQCPIIAITGEKDVQANPEDLKSIENLGKENIKCMTIRNMDHILKEFTGKKTALGAIKQYKKEISHPIHPQLKEALGEWLTKFK